MSDHENWTTAPLTDDELEQVVGGGLLPALPIPLPNIGMNC